MTTLAFPRSAQLLDDATPRPTQRRTPRTPVRPRSARATRHLDGFAARQRARTRLDLLFVGAIVIGYLAGLALLAPGW